MFQAEGTRINLDIKVRTFMFLADYRIVGYNPTQIEKSDMNSMLNIIFTPHNFTPHTKRKWFEYYKIFNGLKEQD